MEVHYESTSRTSQKPVAMPRDLSEEKGSVWKGIAQLEQSPDEDPTVSFEDADMSDSPYPQDGDLSSTGQNKSTVKPYTQALTSLDIESCIKLEEITFPPEERCSREKFEYRFAKCSELSLGLFTSAVVSPNPSSSTSSPHPDPATAETAATAAPVYSGTPDRKSILLAQVIATKTNNPGVRDEDMDFPPDWRGQHGKPVVPLAADESRPGHKENGRTLCIHSLAVLPAFQGQGLGRLLLRSYIQRMEGSGVADRIAIIAHDDLVKYYEGIGFESRGPSPVKLGGGGWTEMILNLSNDD